MPTPRIDSIIQRFVAELTEAIREEGVQAFSAALGANPVSTTKKSAPLRISHPKKKGAKRSPEELAQLTASVLAYVKKNPGQRAEQIAQGLGLTTKDLALPLDKLKADKSVKPKGVRRGTTYTARTARG